jgi:hypothetical protein
VATLPLAIAQLPGPDTDVPAMAWLACTAALVAAARRRPGALPFALIAAALSVGTKTTPAPLAVVVLAIGGWQARAELRRLAVPLAGAFALGTIVGGVWYLRNLVDHGAPFWPLTTTPWGDPIPAPFRAVEASLLSNFRATLHGRLGDYGRALAGGVVLLAGAISAPLWARRKVTVWAAIVVAGAVVIWSAAPYTGISTSTVLAVGATRYLLPCLLAAAVALGLAGRIAPGMALAVLTLALLVNVDRDAVLGFPEVPSAVTVIVGGALGAACALVLRAIEVHARLPVRVIHATPVIIAAIAVGVSLVTLLGSVSGYLAGHAGTGEFDSGVVGWLNSRPAFRDGHQPVVVGPFELASLTGTRLQHRLVLPTASDSCGTVRSWAAHDWVVLQVGLDSGWVRCLAGERPAFADATYAAYAPAALAAR